jgi:hypothetical protein
MHISSMLNQVVKVEKPVVRFASLTACMRTYINRLAEVLQNVCHAKNARSALSGGVGGVCNSTQELRVGFIPN